MPGNEAAKLLYVKTGALKSPSNLGSRGHPLPDQLMLVILGDDDGVSATASAGYTAASRRAKCERGPMVDCEMAVFASAEEVMLLKGSKWAARVEMIFIACERTQCAFFIYVDQMTTVDAHGSLDLTGDGGGERFGHFATWARWTSISSSVGGVAGAELANLSILQPAKPNAWIGKDSGLDCNPKIGSL